MARRRARDLLLVGGSQNYGGSDRTGQNLWVAQTVVSNARPWPASPRTACITSKPGRSTVSHQYRNGKRASGGDQHRDELDCGSGEVNVCRFPLGTTRPVQDTRALTAVPELMTREDKASIEEPAGFVGTPKQHGGNLMPARNPSFVETGSPIIRTCHVLDEKHFVSDFAVDQFIHDSARQENSESTGAHS